MDMLGEGKNQLLMYMECAEEIQEGAESSAAEKVKTDAQTFFKTNSMKMNELKCTFLAKAPIKTESPAPASVPATAAAFPGSERVVGKHYYSEQVETARQVEAVPGATKFENLKNFLVGRKKMLETLETMGCRPAGQSATGAGTMDKSGYCSRWGHSEDKCHTKKAQGGLPAGGGQVPKGLGGCAICKAMDHWKNECPERDTGRDNNSGGERKTYAGGGDGVLGPSGNLPTNPTGAGGSNCSCIKNEVA